MNRRGFLGAILAAAVAPAIVRADALMRIVPRETTVHHWDVTCEPGGLMVPDDISRRMMAHLYDNMGLTVFSASFLPGHDIVFQGVTGRDVECIAVTLDDEVRLFTGANTVGLPLTPNGGDIIFCGDPRLAPPTSR